jgi:hypothetical protein
MKGVSVAASGIMLTLLAACSASPSPGPATPELFIAYVTDVDTVAPFNTVTGTLVTPIKVGQSDVAIAITPDGKTDDNRRVLAVLAYLGR